MTTNEITLKDVMNVAFDILEENDNINYTKKYTRKYLIKGFSQVDIPQWEWFGYSKYSHGGLTKQLNKMTNNIKPKGDRWFNFLISLTGYKLCNKCIKPKEIGEFNTDKTTKNGYRYVCKDCDKLENTQYRKNNPEKIREIQKKAYEKKKKQNPGYVKEKSANRRANKRQRIPKWLTKEEKLAIKDFYNGCPEGYHIDHIIPLNGILVSGLHVLANLQYLTIKDNLIKSNRFNII